MDWSHLKKKAQDLLPKNNDEHSDSKVRQWFISLFIRYFSFWNKDSKACLIYIKIVYFLIHYSSF